MNTKINLTYKGVPYTLEYDRMSVKTIEANGFDINEFVSKPLNSIEMAFAGAFIKNHRKIKQSLVNEIYDKCPKKEDLIQALIQMIQETYETLFEDAEPDDEGNASWEIVDMTPVSTKK